MDLQKELVTLESFMGGKDEYAFKRQADYINENFKSESDQKEIESFISEFVSKISIQTEELIHEAESILLCEQVS